MALRPKPDSSRTIRLSRLPDQVPEMRLLARSGKLGDLRNGTGRLNGHLLKGLTNGDLPQQYVGYSSAGISTVV
jgi:hypothetical protein